MLSFPRSPLSSAVGLPGRVDDTRRALAQALVRPASTAGRARGVRNSLNSIATGLTAEQVGLPAGFLSMGFPAWSEVSGQSDAIYGTSHARFL